jgi:hypothetical protein
VTATVEFVANLAPVNALADTAPGFVWRLEDESGDATSIRAFDDELLIINMSVWESIEALWGARAGESSGSRRSATFTCAMCQPAATGAQPRG